MRGAPAAAWRPRFDAARSGSVAGLGLARGAESGAGLGPAGGARGAESSGGAGEVEGLAADSRVRVVELAAGAAVEGLPWALLAEAACLVVELVAAASGDAAIMARLARSRGVRGRVAARADSGGVGELGAGHTVMRLGLRDSLRGSL